MWTEFSWFRVWSTEGNESLGTMKGEEFFGYLSDFHFIKKDSAPWSWLQISDICILIVCFNLVSSDYL
jgi:hypothetical protein